MQNTRLMATKTVAILPTILRLSSAKIANFVGPFSSAYRLQKLNRKRVIFWTESLIKVGFSEFRLAWASQ
jgi:hypothetical protein